MPPSQHSGGRPGQTLSGRVWELFCMLDGEVSQMQDEGRADVIELQPLRTEKAICQKSV